MNLDELTAEIHSLKPRDIIVLKCDALDVETCSRLGNHIRMVTGLKIPVIAMSPNDSLLLTDKDTAVALLKAIAGQEA